MPRSRVHPAGGVGFDLIVALLSAWFIIGIYVDGWAHNNNQVDNSFFTPWHAMLYSGVAAAGLFLAVTQMRNVFKGYTWLHALPRGYLLSLVGVIVFLLGGGFDFWWHETFGFEVNREALYSPAHLILALSGFLILSGPVRAAWSRTRSEQVQGWRGFLPLVIALTLMVGLLGFFTMNTNLYVNWWGITGMKPVDNGDLYFSDMVGISAALVHPLMLMGVLLFAARRWGRQLPFGAVTFVMTISSLLAFWLSLELNILPLPARWITLLAAVAGGVVGDILLRLNSTEVGLRLFAFATPFVWLVAYYFLLDSVHPIWWAIHLTLGMAFVAGIIGLLISFLVVPPALPVDASA
jgi:hypothetical protein